MTATQLARRVSALERELKALKERIDARSPASDRPWWEAEIGRHANDPIFDEIVRLGRQYRRAQRPRRRKTRR